MTKKPTNILFDLYGTLVDIRTDEASPAFWVRLKAGGAPFTKEAYLARCREEAERLPQEGEIDLLRVFSALTGLRGKALSEFARFFRETSLLRLRLFPFAAELLSALRAAGVRLFLFSNAQACFTREELRILGLENSFDGILLSSEAGVKKPSRAFFEYGFRRMRIAAEESVYVGNDLMDDVGGAHGVGMRCLYLQTEQSGEYPNPPAPDLRARDLKDALKILSALI